MATLRLRLDAPLAWFPRIDGEVEVRMPVKKPAPGDDLLHIAQREGLGIDAIRSHPNNRELFASRDPAVLFAEDDVFVPEPEPKRLAVKPGNTYYVVYQPPMRTLHLELRNEYGVPRQTDYTLHEFAYDGPRPKYGPPFPEMLYGFAYRGIIHEELPAAVVRATLLLEDDADHPHVLELGRLDPVSTTRGLKARLSGVGLLTGSVDDTFDRNAIQAVRAFQRAHGLPVTGQADAETRRRLVEAHGG